MFGIIVIIYFAAVVFGICIYAIPGCRSYLLAALSVEKSEAVPASSSKAYLLFRRAYLSLAASRHGIRELSQSVARRPGYLLLALVILMAPISLATLVSLKATVFEFDGSDPAIDRQIATLMAGEHLSPPPALPPEAFMTAEVELARPDVIGASRNWSLLDAIFVQRLLMVFKLMKERHGYEMTLLEGYRSPERQAQLFAKGKSVTQAAANMSYHQYGLAADAAFIREGKVVISERDAWAMKGYQLYGELAEELGLTWGGRWTFQDYGHVELRRKGVLGSASGT